MKKLNILAPDVKNSRRGQDRTSALNTYPEKQQKGRRRPNQKGKNCVGLLRNQPTGDAGLPLFSQPTQKNRF